MATKPRKNYSETYFIDKEARDKERKDVKDYVDLLPKVRIENKKEGFLRSLEEKEKKRYLLREYFKKLRKKIRPHSSQFVKFSWLVVSTPFPQLFEYREGDDKLFKECNPIRFNNFRSAHKLYKSLLMHELKKARFENKASFYKNPRKEDDK